MFDLSGKTILLTGASKGIGAAIAAALGEAGAHLIGHYGGDRAGAEAATSGIPAARRLLVGADLGTPRRGRSSVAGGRSPGEVESMCWSTMPR